MSDYTVRDMIRNQINVKLYTNERIEQYFNTLLKLSKYEIGGPQSMSGGGFKDLDFEIIDTFANYNTNSVMYGKKMTNYVKRIIVEVIKYYESKDFESELMNKNDKSSKLRLRIIKYLHELFETNNISYDTLMQKFNARSNECLMAYMLIAYQNDSLDLMLRTMYTFGRVLPMKNTTDWFDNYRLNAYGNVLNMVMWKHFDREDVYTVDDEPRAIEQSKTVAYDKAVKYLVGSLRAFIIDNDLFPYNVATNKASSKLELADASEFGVEIKPHGIKDTIHNANVTHEHEHAHAKHSSSKHKHTSNNMSGGDVEAIVTHDTHTQRKETNAKNMSAQQICDSCYEHYPYYFGGAHGCDAFFIGFTLTVHEIKQFLDRYPSAHVGYILNTSTYRSGKGEHWVALEFTRGKARLICSQQSDFTCFNDNGALSRAIDEEGFGKEWNDRLIQMDNYSCGSWSFCSLLELLRFKNVKKAVDAMGVNLKNFGKEVGKESNSDIVRDKIVGFTSGTKA